MENYIMEVIAQAPQVIPLLSLLLLGLAIRRVERIETRSNNEISKIRSDIKELHNTILSVKEKVIILQTNYK